MTVRIKRGRTGLRTAALAGIALLILGGCFNPTGNPDPEPEPDPVANPTFSPGAGVFEPPVSVTISSATEGALIRYTIDGTAPTAAVGIEYSGPIALNRSATVNAIAYSADLPDSEVENADFALPKVYVARESDGEVTVIAGATGAILTSITVGSLPVGIATDPASGRVWVANQGDDSVSVIEAETDTVVATITSIPSVRQLAVNPATNTVYATANEIGIIDSVYPIDVNTSVAGAAIAVGENPDGISVNTVTNRIYVSHASSEDAYVIDGATNTVVASSIAAGSQPQGVAVNEGTNNIYVASNIDNTLEIIDGDTNLVTGQVILGGFGTPWGIAINQDTGIAYVAATDFPGTVRVVDTAINTETTSVSVGDNPTYVAVNQSRNLVYVTSWDAKEVAVIDGASNTVIDTIDLSPGAEPAGIAVLP